MFKMNAATHSTPKQVVAPPFRLPEHLGSADSSIILPLIYIAKSTLDAFPASCFELLEE